MLNAEFWKIMQMAATSSCWENRGAQINFDRHKMVHWIVNKQ